MGGGPATVRLGTRGSSLALIQTRLVAEMVRLTSPHVSTEERIYTTRGDVQAQRPLPEIGGQGVFTAELERALLAGEIDAAVHSLKDLPVRDRPGLSVVAVACRVDPEDALISVSDASLADLPPHARVGTSSLRRTSQLLAARPDLQIAPLRGNIETRLARVTPGDMDAAVLAVAGLERLGLAARISARLPVESFVPAPGQGALAIQCRSEGPAAELFAALDDDDVRCEVTAEREFLECLGGGCSLPVGALARRGANGALTLRVYVGSEDGSRTIQLSAQGDDPVALGRAMAAEAFERGARELLP